MCVVKCGSPDSSHCVNIFSRFGGAGGEALPQTCCFRKSKGSVSVSVSVCVCVCVCVCEE